MNRIRLLIALALILALGASTPLSSPGTGGNVLSSPGIGSSPAGGGGAGGAGSVVLLTGGTNLLTGGTNLLTE